MLVRVKALNWGNSPAHAEHENKGLQTLMMMMMIFTLAIIFPRPVMAQFDWINFSRR